MDTWFSSKLKINLKKQKKNQSHLSIAEKEVEAIPEEDYGAKYEVGQPKPKYPWLKPGTTDNSGTCGNDNECCQKK